ncbi:hypothetical protein CKO28_14320 [Rhodovibrio sodomensis]|uniref:YgiT-type zinc finger domain-containing protein n=1 Tax=Rhodovibrio sodomensis TaxID=1088 RepID=A0ABS1DG44_9PROT|nr:hypothetical protein [Rhodovibrio sodomensis]MBK1669209.1 hypothetical protein [Rhodovibrio sodomensis]
MSFQTCPKCHGEEIGDRVVHHIRGVSGKSIRVDQPVRTCAHCGHDIADDFDVQANAEAVYRELMGMVSPVHLVCYRLSQGVDISDVAEVCRLSEERLHAFESGAILTAAEDREVRKAMWRLEAQRRRRRRKSEDDGDPDVERDGGGHGCNGPV